MPSRTKSSAVTPPKPKLFDPAKYKIIDKPGTNSKSKYTAKKKVQDAVFKIVAAQFQKGDREKEYTGAMYAWARPRNAKNIEFKEKTEQHLFTEKWRWNERHTVYTSKIWTIKQAQKILDAMLTIDGCKEDLDAKVDETEFVHANTYEIAIYPETIENEDGEKEDVICVLGTNGATYPWKDKLDNMGFKYISTENPTKWRASSEDVNVNDLSDMFREYGFDVEVYDGTE